MQSRRGSFAIDHRVATDLGAIADDGAELFQPGGDAFRPVAAAMISP